MKNNIKLLCLKHRQGPVVAILPDSYNDKDDQVIAYTHGQGYHVVKYKQIKDNSRLADAKERKQYTDYFRNRSKKNIHVKNTTQITGFNTKNLK